MNIIDNHDKKESLVLSGIELTFQYNEESQHAPYTSDDRNGTRVGLLLTNFFLDKDSVNHHTNNVQARHTLSKTTSCLWFMIYSPVRAINEKNYLLLIWKCMVLTQVYYFFVIYAWQIISAFQHNWTQKHGYNNPIYLITFTIDIFLNFHISYTTRGKNVMDITQTAEHYIKTLFLFDMIAFGMGLTFIYSIHLFSDMVCVIVFFILKLPSQKIMDNYIEDLLYVHRKRHAMYKIFKICYLLFVITNLITMLFYLAGVAAFIEHKHSWLTSDSGFGLIEELDQKTQLLLAFYWSFGTLMMMNNGDITPKNDYEIMVYFIAILLGINVFALSLALLQEMVQILSKDHDELKNQLRLMTIYMRQRNIPSCLQDEITSYLGEMIHQKQLNDIEVQQDLIESLPEPMKLELTYQTFKVVFEAVKIMDMFSVTFKQQLSMEYEQQLFSEGDFIYLDNQSEYNVPFLYYIVSGEIGVFFNSTSDNQSFYLLQEGRYFGLTSFITDQSRNESMCALTFCKLYAISRAKFLQVIEGFPQDKEKFLNTMHGAVFNDSLAKFCYSCGQTNHDLIKCPEIRHIPDFERLQTLWNQAMINMQPDVQSRQKKFKRYNKKTKSSIKQIYQLKLTKLNSLEQVDHQSIGGENLQTYEGNGILSPELIMLQKIYEMLLESQSAQLSDNDIDCINDKDIETYQIDIDRVCNFQYFLPHNNIKSIILNDIWYGFQRIYPTQVRRVTLPRNKILIKYD